MLQFERRLILSMVLAVCVGAASPFTSYSQSDSGPTGAPELSEKRLQVVFDSARGFIERENYNNAFPLLQAILNQSRDAMIQIDPENPAQSVSLKGEALKTLRALPRSARQSYNLQFNAQARELLETAREGSERSVLEEVVRRYFFTETGRDAAFRLANLYFDRGEFFTAGLVFERLLEDGRISRELIPRILFQSAVCWYQSDQNQKAHESLVRLKSIPGAEELLLAGRPLRLFEDAAESLAWLERHADLATQSRNSSRVRSWLTFRGNSERNASSDPVMPLREKEWEFRTVPLAEASDPRQIELVEQNLRELTEKFQNTSYLAFPAYQPLVIDNQIIFRSLGNVKSVDAATGEHLWENHFLDPKFETLLQNSLESFSLNDSRISEMQRYVMQRSWRDLSSGQISSDGQYIYVIEKQGLVTGEYGLYGRTSPLEKNTENYLMAYQVGNGKEVWGLGGKGTPYEGGVFLGTPLVQGDELYCLIERNEELRLLALRNQVSGSGSVTPVELWSQPLSISTAQEESFGDPLRRISGLSPTYGNGLLICPTGRGTIFAYDLAQRIFRWRYEYQDAALHTNQTISSLNQFRQHHGVGPEDESRWLDPTPVASGNRLFVTPTESDFLYCLDAREGTLLWSVPRDDDLYLACVHRNTVVLVGRERIHGLDVRDGQELWTISIPRPSGRGYLADGRYFIPLSTAAIACVDLSQGELLAIVPSEYSRVPGNLVAAGGNVISLSADRLFCYETEVPTAPESPELLDEMRGKQKLFEGRLTEAIDLLLRTHDSRPTSARRLLLTELLFDAVRRDFSGNARYINRLEEFTRDTPEATMLEELRAEGYRNSGNLREAFRIFLNLAHRPKKEIQRKNHRIRNDVWIRANLEDLYQTGTPDDRAAFDQLLDEMIAAVQDPVSSSDFLQLIEGLPGRESLLRNRIERIDPYTETLAFEQALIQLQHSSSPEPRREGLARQFKWLMKLDRIEQAAILRERLLDEHADEICLDGQTGAELARWSVENRKLADYLTSQAYQWPPGPPRIAPYSASNILPRGLFTPIAGDPGLFRGWRFEYANNPPRRLLGFDAFGNQRIELPISYLNHPRYQLNHDRKIRLYGHLAVLEFYDYFLVYDLFQSGEQAFLHGPHHLTQPLAGVETSSTRIWKTRSVTASNGHPDIEVVDLFDQPFGKIGVITESAIVHQNGRWMIAIDSLSGKTLWQRHLASRGQHLFGDRNTVCALATDSHTVSLFRTRDGSPSGEYDLGPIDRILAKHAGRLVVQSNLESRTRIVCHDVPGRRVLWQLECEPESLFHTIDTTELAILERSGQVRIVSLDDGSPRAQPRISPPNQSPPAGEKPPGETGPATRWQAFWIHPFRDGWLILMQESLTEQNPVIRVSQFSDSVAVHGDVIYVGRDGDVRWSQRIEHQGFSITHPATTPVIALSAKQTPVPGQFVRIPQSALDQFIDLATGEPLGPQSNHQQHSGFQIVVSPADSRAEILSSKSSHSVVYGPEATPRIPGPPE